MAINTDTPMFRKGEWSTAEWVTPAGYLSYLTDCIHRWERLGEWKQAESIRQYKRRFIAEYAVYLQ